MTRPRKQTVEWFPHSCTHGKTIFLLEKKYGVLGYVFWFKLLELLGTSEGHAIKYADASIQEYVKGYTYGDDATDEVLDFLATLEAIDSELWASKIIWSENFVKGVAPTYQNRRVETPPKPVIYTPKPPADPISTSSQPVDYSDLSEKGREGKGREGEKIKDLPPKPPKKVKGLETRLPDNYGISDSVRAWAAGKGFDRLDEHLEAFKDYAMSRGKTYVDWDSAFKRAIREDWGKIRQGSGALQVHPALNRPLSKAERITQANLAAREAVLNEEP